MSNPYVHALAAADQIAVRFSGVEQTIAGCQSLLAELEAVNTRISVLKQAFDANIDGGPETIFDEFAANLAGHSRYVENQISEEAPKLRAFLDFIRGTSGGDARLSLIHRLEAINGICADQSNPWYRMTPEQLEDEIKKAQHEDAERTFSEINKRENELRDTGIETLQPDDKDLYSRSEVIATVLNNKDTILKMSEKYGIPPALLAGTIAAEMDFDHDNTDRLMDGVLRNTEPGIIDDAIHTFLGNGAAPGVGSIRTDALTKSIEYLQTNKLPGWQDAKTFDMDLHHRATFDGSVEAAAIELAGLKHYKGGATSPQDMAVIWGGYRAGVEGFAPDSNRPYTQNSFVQNKIGDPNGIPPQFQIGRNAYISEPYFAYFQKYLSE